MGAFQTGLYLRTIFGGSSLDESSSKRRAVRGLFTTAYPLYELFTHGCLALDHTLFPEFKNTPIEQPVFIVGNPRSGTTYFHRLLASDALNFVSTNAWQIGFPALCQYKVLRKVGLLDDKLGGAMSRWLESKEDKFLKNADPVHRTRMAEPEEDDALLLHVFASAFLMLAFPRPELQTLGRFDELDADLRRQVIGFYKSCVQRLIYEDGGRRRLLSKNPNFTHKMKSLHETFPDAKFIYLVRHPADTIASVHSMITRIWESQGLAPKQGDATLARPGLVAWAEWLYRHGDECLKTLPAESIITVRYEDLIARPDEEVKRVYGELGLDVSPEFDAFLAENLAKTRGRKSKHHYSLSDYGLSQEAIEELVPFVYERFGYQKRSTVS